MGILDRVGFGRLKEGLARTREGLLGKVLRIVGAGGAIDDDLLERLEEALIAGDVGAQMSEEIIASIRERVKREGARPDLLGLLKEEVSARLGALPNSGTDRPSPKDRPTVILVVGINGVGKTTTIGKLAHRYVREGRRVMIAAADTFRAAANEQLAIWARRSGAEIIRQGHGADPGAVAFDAISSAAAHGAHVVIVDTAGRLHTKVNLMEELKKIRRVVQKLYSDAPDEVLLVIDASTGQNGLQQAKQFSGAVGVTGIVLTKLDGTAKGGIILPIARDLAIPIRYIGVGEGIEDLQPFDGRAFADALFGGADEVTDNAH